MYGQTNTLYELQVRPNGRAAADEYFHNGVTWIEGRDGSKYTIYIKNNSAIRVMAVVSVDGLDVLSGKPAGINSPGYIIEAHNSIEIPGWKLNNQEAAEFYFSRKSNSYVTQIGGNATNTGVIGVMIFEAYQPPQYVNMGGAGRVEYPTNLHTAANFPSAGPAWTTGANGAVNQATYQLQGAIPTAAVAPTLNNISISFTTSEVGTGFGDAVQHSTTNATFIKRNPNQADAVMVVYYDSADNLKRMGIQLRSKTHSRTPNPFPAGVSSTTGCTPPPSWVR